MLQYQVKYQSDVDELVRESVDHVLSQHLFAPVRGCDTLGATLRSVLDQYAGNVELRRTGAA
jgi:hypothetical protein